VNRSGPSGFRLAVVVLVALVVVLAGLGVSVGVVAAVAVGVRAAANQLTSAPPTRAARSGTVTEAMEILTGKVQRERHIVTRYGQGYGPMYTNAFWSVHVGDTVVVRITSYDDGAAPLTGAQTMFDRVEGTLGGTETVDGRPVQAVPNDEVAHTFTVVGLGLNLPIPAAPSGGSVTVVARFVAQRAGSFVWQCYAPCGSGPNLMGGPMATMGWMEGKVQVLP
jgi:hypothetical protein